MKIDSIRFTAASPLRAGLSPVAFLLLVVLAFLTPLARAVTYYVDSVAGNDANNGTSTGTPWNTLTKVNGITFAAGDQILFKCGSAWSGQLLPHGSGTSAAPIVFGSYGTGAKPILNGGGVAQTIKLYNVEYVTIQNLELTNIGSGGPGTLRDGIRITAEGIGVRHGIQILNNDIHDIYGASTRTNNAMYKNAAIFVEVLDNGGTMSGYADMLIQGNDIHDIRTAGFISNTPSNYWQYPLLWATNLKIRSNVFDQTGCDHIIINGANAPLIEYNAGFDAGINGSGYQYIAGMWPSYYCQDATFQFNEVARTHNELTGVDGDSEAFDVDLGAKGTTTFQYNYTHDNQGGVLLVMYDNVKKDIIYRYNLSQNDGHHNGQDRTLSVSTWSIYAQAYIYNNVFYNATDVVSIQNYPGQYYLNNIFQSPVSSTYGSWPIFSHNLYYGHTATVSDPYKITANPQFVAPGTGTDGYDTVSGYKIQSTSPAINAGVAIPNNGGGDFWGNALYDHTYADIGAHEFVGGTAAAPSFKPVTLTYEHERMRNTSSGDTQTIVTDAAASGGKYHQIAANAVGDYVEYEVFVTEPATFEVQVKAKTANNQGICQLSIDGTNLGGPIDLYSATTSYPLTDLGSVSFATVGVKKFRFTVTGKNAASTGYALALDSIVLISPPPSGGTTITVDNTDTANVTLTGTWVASTATPGYYGSNYLHDNNTGATGGKSVRFTPNVPATTTYAVYARWTAYSNRASNVPIDINYAGNSQTVYVDQRSNGGTWVYLGSFPFAAGTSGNVTVRNDGANGYVVADAVQLRNP